MFLTDTRAVLRAHRRGRPGPTIRQFVHLSSCFIKQVPCCGRTDAGGRCPHSSDLLCPVSESSIAARLGYCVLTVTFTVTFKASLCPICGPHHLEGAGSAWSVVSVLVVDLPSPCHLAKPSVPTSINSGRCISFSSRGTTSQLSRCKYFIFLERFGIAGDIQGLVSIQTQFQSSILAPPRPQLK
jgi:hypothetical protein